MRWPLKTFVFLVTVLLVLYPKVWLIPTQCGRLQDLNSVLEPEHPALAELESQVIAAAGEDATPDDVRAAVMDVVYARVPYGFDWEVWGVMDYLPTVDEVFTMGREDCDGRAVVAASLLRRLGHEAWLVTDIKHVWVVTCDASQEHEPREIMDPGTGAKTLVGGESGTRPTVNLEALMNLGRGLTFGIAVFPLGREVVLVLVLCAVTLHPWSSLRRRIIGCLLLGGALTLFRWSGAAPAALASEPLLVWSGLLAGVGGWLLLAIKAAPTRGGARRGGD
ncbi:MAG: hypothetical protein KAY37_00790 [Phycisphaerae bacterium]|nr:hypothetical protein [Phycisphaerae bacterium]